MENLISRAKKGDKSAESELFHFLLVRFKYLAKRKGLGEDADDIAQDACLTVLEKYREADPEGRFEAWVYGVLKRKIGNYYQHREVRRRIIVKEDELHQVKDYPSNTSHPESRRQLYSCLKKLIRQFPRYARALNLIHQGYKTEEICQRLDIKPGNLYVILNRGRYILNECLNGKE